MARILSEWAGVIEPLQSKSSIDDLIEELKDQIIRAGDPPMHLIGHSWGAWLAVLFAARYPDLTAQLILVGCPPFDPAWAPEIGRRRMSRLSLDEQAALQSLIVDLKNQDRGRRHKAIEELGFLLRKTDSVDPDPDLEESVFDPDLFSATWDEADALRAKGELMQILAMTSCPITLFHGDCDPHPIEGVIIPLARLGIDFDRITLPACGHSPFLEKSAAPDFYRMLIETLKDHWNDAETARSAG